MDVKIIIALYFLVVLCVGVYSYFMIKTPADYYVSGKKAGLIPVSGSLLATILGGSAVLGTIELSQKIGWAALWFLCSGSIGLFLLIPLTKYVSKFGRNTLPELLGTFYGKKAEIISSVIIPVAWIGVITVQIIAAAKVLGAVGFLSYNNSAILAGAVFIFYTLVGGQKSVLKTDIVQSVIIITGLTILLVFSLRKGEIYTDNSLTISALFNSSFSFFDLIILFLTYSVTFVVGPDIYSRVFCAKNAKTARQSVILVAVILVPVAFTLTWLGIYSNHFTKSSIVDFAENLLPGWAYGIFISALLSVVMSSAATLLLTTSMILSELTTGDLIKKEALQFTRFYILIIGAVSIVIALYITSIIQTLLLALTFFSGAFVVPTLAGLLRLKVNKTMVVPAIIVGGTIALAGKITADFYNNHLGNSIVILAYIVNTAFLFANRKK